jgi:hypothetical protein
MADGLDSIATLYAQGLPMSEIGEALSVSRGKVAFVIHRARRAGDARFRARPPAPKAEVEGVKVGIVKPTSPVEKPRLLIDLDWNGCRWPVGVATDGRHTFCGSAQVPGHPYCERHSKAVRSGGVSASRATASVASSSAFSLRAPSRLRESV